MADPSLFDQQFSLVERLMSLDIDLYFYITLTAPSKTNFESAVPRFQIEYKAFMKIYL